jgi:hypothetical protein
MDPANDPVPRFRQYALRLLAWLALGLVAVIAIGLVTDPYAFSWPHRHLDPAFRQNDLEVRMNIVSQIQPDVLLLGNSRAQHGLDPHNPVFAGEHVFNAAIVNAKPGDLGPILTQAQRHHALKTLVMTIDYNMLYGGPERRIPNQNLLRREGPFALLARIRAVLSVDALWTSLLELQRFVRGTDHVFDTDGRLLEGLYAHDIVARGGTLAAVRQRDAEAMGHMTEKPYGAFMQSVSSVVDPACANGTRVILFISPLHARQLESIQQAGKWDDFVAWKQAAVNLVSSKTGCNITLWDFARHSKITEEPVPQSGPMKYYWESSHYRKLVGDAILTATVGGQSDPHVWQAKFGDDFDGSFGEQLTASGFLASMQREDQARDAWRKANPAIVSDVASLKNAATSGGE